MEQQFWLDRWEQRQIGFHLPEVNAHLRKHWSALALDAGERVLVPLCGKSKDMLWLHELGHLVTGVELSHIAVQAFFAENALEMNMRGDNVYFSPQAPGIRVHQSDFFTLAPEQLGEIRAVYDRAALVALPDQMRKQYVQQLAGLLTPGATVLLVTMDYPQEQMDGPPFNVDGKEVCRLYGEMFDIQLLESLDVLAGNDRLAERGLTRMLEQIWKLTRL